MFFSHDNISLYYEKYGKGKKSIVILPGWGDTRKTFHYLVLFLSRFFTIYIPDYPGFGQSKFPNKTLNIFDYTNLIHEWIKKLELDDPILIGHSFGGRIIITLTGYYKYKFSNIILMDAAGIKPKKSILKCFRTISYKFLKKLGKIMPLRFRDIYMNKLFKIFASTDYKNLSEEMRNTFKNIVNYDLKNYLKNIDSRVLLIWGNNDDATPVHDAKIMNNKIKDSELIILDKVGHFPYLERASLINSIIYEQLKNEIEE